MTTSIAQLPQDKASPRHGDTGVIEPGLKPHRPVNPLYRGAVDYHAYHFRHMSTSVSEALGWTDERSFVRMQKTLWEQNKDFKFSPEDPISVLSF